MSRRPALVVLTAIAFHAMAAGAQAPGNGLKLRAAGNGAAANGGALVDGGTVLTTVFTVQNLGADTARVKPVITTPRGWAVVMGNAPFAVAPGASDTWLVGISVPRSAPAASYMVGGALLSGGGTVSDSVAVRVLERRGLEVLPLEMPGWVMAGSRYEARFLVRNRGNVQSAVALSGATSRGTRGDAVPARTTIAPGASTIVSVQVPMVATLVRSTDDVLELTAMDLADAGIRVTASARTTVVPNSSASGFATIPAMLSLRSIGGASGVAPVALVGGGLLADSATFVDFSLQSPTGRQTPFGFGEREEYRANFSNDHFSLKLGDNAYGFSPLISSGMTGTGAEYDGRIGTLSAGAYAQRLRWLPGSVSEAGVMLGSAPDSTRNVFATFAERQSFGRMVSVGSVSGRLRLSRAASVQLEAASSDSDHAVGTAGRARFSGSAGKVSYDFGVLHGGSDFAGNARGTTVRDGVVSARLWSQLAVSASGSSRISNFATPLSGVPAQRFSTGNLTASWGGLATVEYLWMSRHDDGGLTPLDGTQRGVRAASSLPLGPASLSVSFERGLVNAESGSATRPYSVVSVSAQTRLWNVGSLSVFGARGDGNTLTGSTSGVANAGVDLRVRLPLHLELAMSSSAQRATLGVFDGSGSWFSQSDARLDYRFSGGQTLSLRERIWQNPMMQGSANARAVYLEFRTPLRLPIGPSRAAGRAEGRIVEAETKRPLAGALVRIGDQAAVTDRDGRVFFNGLAAARQRVSLDATGAAAGAMLVGDAFVDTRENPARPATFALAVARGGVVRAVVRRLAPALGTLAANKDSMVTVAMESNVLAALTSGRDTIYQSSDDRGRLDFGAVSPGTWTLIVMPGERPDHYVFEKDRVEFTVEPGQRRDVELRLVPQRRTVTFIGTTMQ